MDCPVIQKIYIYMDCPTLEQKMQCFKDRLCKVVGVVCLWSIQQGYTQSSNYKKTICLLLIVHRSH